MPAPSTMANVSTTASSNYPAGTELPSALDDAIRALGSVVKQDVSKGTDITAASSITIPESGSYFVVTGNTGISTINNASWTGREVTLKFSGTPTLTHSSGLILPGSANITAAAGDVAKVVYESTGVWRCTVYQYATGAALIANNSVTYAKIQDVSATSRVLGRKTAGAGDTEECTLSEILDFIGSAAQGDILYRDAAGWARLGAGTSGYFLKTQGAGANPVWGVAGGITLGTPTASTSGTSIDFTGIPATAKRIIINGIGVSTNGTSPLACQLGDSGGIENTGYVSGVGKIAGAVNFQQSTTMFLMSGDATDAVADAMSFKIQLDLENASNNTWTFSSVMVLSGTAEINIGGGHKATSGTLDRVRITTVGGTATFDAGEINIAYE